MTTLYIIGNGFDLYHGLHTSYSDFHDFLSCHGEGDLIDSMEHYWGHYDVLHGEHTLWSDLERALGEYNVKDIMDDMFEGHSLDIDHIASSVGEVDAEVTENFVPLRERLNEQFSSWVRSMDFSRVSRKSLQGFAPSGLFLVFNYTDTLEKVYGVSSSQVLHIHGDAGNLADELIVGHDKYDRTEYQHQIASVINGLYKDTAKIISRHHEFFSQLSSIDTVVVYGHSIADVDLPYFQEIKRNIQPNATWHISYHGDSIPDDIKAGVSKLGICNVNYFNM